MRLWAEKRDEVRTQARLEGARAEHARARAFVEALAQRDAAQREELVLLRAEAASLRRGHEKCRGDLAIAQRELAVSKLHCFELAASKEELQALCGARECELREVCARVAQLEADVSARDETARAANEAEVARLKCVLMAQASLKRGACDAQAWRGA